MMTALWGMSFPIMKSINIITEQHLGTKTEQTSATFQVLSASFLIATRFSVAAFFLTVLLPKVVFGANRYEWRAGVWIGLAFYLGLICQVVGLSSISASRSGFLTSLTAVSTPLLSAFVLKQKLTWQIACGSLLAFTGVAILSDATSFFATEVVAVPLEDQSRMRWGDLWTTLGALFFSGQIMLVDYYGKRARSTNLTSGMFFTTAGAAWAVFILFQTVSPGTIAGGVEVSETGAAITHRVLGWADWGSLLFHPAFVSLVVFLGIVGSVFTFVGMNKYQPYLSAGQASVIYSTEPVFASCWAMVIPGFIGWWIYTGYLNESVTWQLGVGGGLILLANFVAILPNRRRQV